MSSPSVPLNGVYSELPMPRSPPPVAHSFASRAVGMTISSQSVARLLTGSHALEIELRERLVAQRTTVDRELDPGHVLRLVRCEVGSTRGDVGGFAEARDHDVLLERGAIRRVLEDCRH